METNEEIAVGMDGSAGAVAALRWAVDEAERRGAHVVALRAWSYLDQEHPFDPAYGHDEVEATYRAELVAAVGETAAGAIEARVVCDLAARALLDASKDADLLVVGARGLGGFRGLLLGSVSQQCLHHARVPVAVVRPAPEVDVGHVVVGIDGSVDSRRALAWAVAEGRLRHTEVEVVHAWNPAVPTGVPYAIAYEPVDRVEDARTLLDEEVAGIDGSGLPRPVRATLSSGTPARAIIEAAEAADLVVVGSRGVGRLQSLVLGSVSQQVVLHAPCTVVVLPSVD